MKLKPFLYITIFISAQVLCSSSLVSEFEAEAQAPPLPKVVSAIAPVLPRSAALARLKGNVTAELKLDSNGDVTHTRILEGHPLLRQSIESAARGWKFSPASDEVRTVILTFLIPTVTWGEITRVAVLPYDLEVDSKLEDPDDTESYIPIDFVSGKYHCEVHRVSLQVAKVKVRYGLIGFKKGYLEAEKRLFPHSRKVVFGGCVVEDVKYAKVLYCCKCRAAEARWSKEHEKEKRFDH